MHRDAIIGMILLFSALGLLTYLVMWSRRVIDRVARGDVRSAREIEKALQDES